MERIVTELGIQESVEFLGVRTDVVDLLQQSWAFVLPSRWEGLPSALTEAMACKLPCIAARVSGSEDVIIDGVNGLLVEPEQPVELAHALRRIIEDSNLAQRLAQEAYATVKRDYQLTTVTQHFLELYRRLLKKNEVSTITAAQEQEIQQDVSIIAAKGDSGE
jgi:glycosyltransferase involved in cell wall biosynthesis